MEEDPILSRFKKKKKSSSIAKWYSQWIWMHRILIFAIIKPIFEFNVKEHIFLKMSGAWEPAVIGNWENEPLYDKNTVETI